MKIVPICYKHWKRSIKGDICLINLTFNWGFHGIYVVESSQVISASLYIHDRFMTSLKVPVKYLHYTYTSQGLDHYEFIRPNQNLS